MERSAGAAARQKTKCCARFTVIILSDEPTGRRISVEGEKLRDTRDPVFLQAPLHHRPFLHRQTLVEDGRSEGFGVEVKGERTLLVEAGEEQFAAGGHFLCG